MISWCWILSPSASPSALATSLPSEPISLFIAMSGMTPPPCEHRSAARDSWGILARVTRRSILKAPSFAYAKAKSLAEAFELAARPGARILAGGQSLIPSLNMRLAAAEVAHPAIRNRGTLGGSLALADPAAEYPACALALEATVVLAGRAGERRVAASRFFRGLFETDIRSGEILVAAEFPRAERSLFIELARRQGDYAIVGLACVADAVGRCFAFCGVGATPMLAQGAARAATLDAALKALRKDLDPPADLYHSPATKLHLAGVLLSRAWNTLSKP